MDAEELFNLSYWRVLKKEVENKSFLDTFYSCFVESSDEVAALFENTDFHKQMSMLQMSLAHIASFNAIHGPDALMRKLVGRHTSLEINPSLFQNWMDALLLAVSRHDPEYSDEIRAAWLAKLTPGVVFFTRACAS